MERIVDDEAKEVREVIKHQKAVAEELLALSRLVDPSAALLGGAPRNWELKEPAKDLDIYIYRNEWYRVGGDFIKSLSAVLGVPVKEKVDGKEKDKYGNERVLGVYDAVFKEVDVQFIIISQEDPVSFARETFPCNLSMKKWSKGKVVDFFPWKNDKMYLWAATPGEVTPYMERMFKYFPNMDFEVLDGGIGLITAYRAKYPNRRTTPSTPKLNFGTFAEHAMMNLDLMGRIDAIARNERAVRPAAFDPF